MIPDQTDVWNIKHRKGDHDLLRGHPSPLAELAEPYFPRNARILELGCGVGRDALYFARQGNEVMATDASEVVVQQNNEQSRETGLQFSVLDMQQPLPYEEGSFDVVYANLSLHYYLDQGTREIVRNIAKVLRNEGIFAFGCKSRDDSRTIGANEVEKDVFVESDNHVLHLFSEDYAKSILQGLFDVVSLDEVHEEYNGRHSNIVRCIAKRRVS